MPYRSELRMVEMAGDSLSLQWLEIVASENVIVNVKIAFSEQRNNPSGAFYLNNGSTDPANAVPLNTRIVSFQIRGKLIRNLPCYHSTTLSAFLGLPKDRSFDLNIEYH